MGIDFISASIFCTGVQVYSWLETSTIKPGYHSLAGFRVTPIFSDASQVARSNKSPDDFGNLFFARML
jgi:hypothetical protein